MPLTQKEVKLLKAALQKIKKGQSTLLPEEEALIEDRFPSGGLHVHDDNNPFGIHRHNIGDPLDGAHTHSPQNPEGEHFHVGDVEPNQDRNRIDGSHNHQGPFDNGWHNHNLDSEVNEGGPVPQKPDNVI